MLSKLIVYSYFCYIAIYVAQYSIYMMGRSDKEYKMKPYTLDRYYNIVGVSLQCYSEIYA